MAHHIPFKFKKAQDFLSDNDFPSLSEVSTKAKTSGLSSSKASFSYSDKLKAYHQNEKWPNSSQAFSHFVTQDTRKNAVTNPSENTRIHHDENNYRIKSDRISCRPISREVSVNNHKIDSSVSQANSHVEAHSRKSEVLQPYRQQNKISEPRKLNTDIHSDQSGFILVKSNTKKAAKTNISEQATAADSNVEVKKKRKNRKSKVKRQAARQSGKVTLLTPEAHFKITNQSNSNTSKYIGVSTNINDSEEYPELGKTIITKINRPSIKRNIDLDKVLTADNADQIKEESEAEEQTTHLKPLSDSEELKEDSLSKNISIGKTAKPENEAVLEKKAVVHPKDPITASFFDFILPSKSKTKEKQETKEPPPTDVPVRIVSKKGHSQPHNLLDSTCVAKRGKERENPKPKKKTHMKKIIIMDRLKRREHLEKLQCLKENMTVENAISNAGQLDSSVNNQSNEKSTILDTINVHNEDLPFMVSSLNESIRSEEEEIFTSDSEIITNSSCSSNQENVAANEPAESVTHYQASDKESSKSQTDENECDNNVPMINGQEDEHFMETRNSENSDSSRCEHVNILKSVLNSNICEKDFTTNKLSRFSEQERLHATKILMHSRKFREYCFHLTSKEIDNAVSALLTDLARFQDRLHQKDPVKAHMKRRMVYGIKEVKKHLKLRKLKCVILATDIENIQTEGGLNDVLDDLKRSAADHQIPCIFALGKRRLGKLCHKPVAVSCIGVFNYEGSEVNFKKMIELLDQSKEDYNKIVQIVISKLSDDEIEQLIQVSSVAPEKLWYIRTEILRNIIIQKLDKNTDMTQEILVPCYVEKTC